MVYRYLEGCCSRRVSILCRYPPLSTPSVKSVAQPPPAVLRGSQGPEMQRISKEPTEVLSHLDLKGGQKPPKNLLLTIYNNASCLRGGGFGFVSLFSSSTDHHSDS